MVDRILAQFGVLPPQPAPDKPKLKKKYKRKENPWKGSLPGNMAKKWERWNRVHHENPDGWEDMQRLATAKGTPRPVLDALIESGKTDILVAMATNPYLPGAVLGRLAFYPDHNVAEAAVLNIAAPVELLEKVVRTHPSAEIREAARDAIGEELTEGCES